MACPGPLYHGGTEPPPAVSVGCWWLAAVYFYGDWPFTKWEPPALKMPGRLSREDTPFSQGQPMINNRLILGQKPGSLTSGWHNWVVSLMFQSCPWELAEVRCPLNHLSAELRPLPHPTSFTVLQVSLEITSLEELLAQTLFLENLTSDSAFHLSPSRTRVSLAPRCSKHGPWTCSRSVTEIFSAGQSQASCQTHGIYI